MLVCDVEPSVGGISSDIRVSLHQKLGKRLYQHVKISERVCTGTLFRSRRYPVLSISRRRGYAVSRWIPISHREYNQVQYSGGESMETGASNASPLAWSEVLCWGLG